MDQKRPGGSTGGAVAWFALSVVITVINFRSASHGSWLGLVLGAFSLFVAIRYGKLLLERWRALKPRPRTDYR